MFARRAVRLACGGGVGGGCGRSVARRTLSTAAASDGGGGAGGDRPGLVCAYPPFVPSLSVAQFAAAYGHLPSGARAAGQPVRLAGRVTARRESGSKLVFLDIEAGGTRVQVLAAAAHYVGASATEAAEAAAGGGGGAAPPPNMPEFEHMRSTIRRGDYVGGYLAAAAAAGAPLWLRTMARLAAQA